MNRKICLLLTPILFASLFAAQKMNPEELVARHLEAIGTAEAIAARKNCQVEGRIKALVLAGPNASPRHLEGQATFLSEGRSFRSSLHFPASGYPTDELSFDGKTTYVSQINPDQRSRIGKFLYQYESILKEGLFGGTLSTAWPLLDLKSRKPKLKYAGLKTPFDEKLHELRYQLRKAGHDLRVYVYFHPGTFQHAATKYRIRAPSITGLRVMSRGPYYTGQQPTYYTLEERFGEYRTINGLTLPFHWTVRLIAAGPEALESQFGVGSWGVAFDTVKLNVLIDPKSFVLY